jgi:hypothetical protein
MSNILKRLILGKEQYHLFEWMKEQEKINREMAFALGQIGGELSEIRGRLKALGTSDV